LIITFFIKNYVCFFGLYQIYQGGKAPEKLSGVQRAVYSTKFYT